MSLVGLGPGLRCLEELLGPILGPEEVAQLRRRVEERQRRVLWQKALEQRYRHDLAALADGPGTLEELMHRTVTLVMGLEIEIREQYQSCQN